MADSFFSDERAPRLEVTPQLRAAAGTATTGRVTITNLASQPRVMALSVHGLDPAWLPAPSRSRALQPGESIVADVVLHPAVGTLAARYPLAVAVQALDPVTGRAASPTALAELVLVVDAPGQIALALSPAEARAVFGKRITIELRNSGALPAKVDLQAQGSRSARLSLARSSLDVPAGGTATVRGRVRPRRVRLFGARERHTYTITARSAGAPRHAEGALVSRAMLGPRTALATALVAVVACWVALAIVYIPKLADHVKSGTAVTAQQAAGTGSAAPGSGGSGSAGPGSGSSSGGAGGSGSPGSGGGANASTVQLNGTVAGNSPGGVTVSMRPTSLVDEAAEGAIPVGGTTTQSASEVGMIPAEALAAADRKPAGQNRTVTTTTDGAWSFPSVPKPGYYLVTFAKSGFQTVRYIIDSATASATKPLNVTLSAGEGQLNGVVTGPGGKRVGGATITITDGTNTITTSSDSTGDVGSWSVIGLSTPSTYLVTASAEGLSTESKLVPLAASGAATVSLALRAGVALITGTVGSVGGDELGGVTVTATDGAKVSRTATTVTEDGLRGRYTLSGLPLPGRYTLTFTATGYLTQTVQVMLRKGQSSATQNVTLFPSTTTITGTVATGTPTSGSGGSASDGCAATGTTMTGAGLILTSSDNTYKTTSGAEGAYQFDGVAPGTYVLSAQYAGRLTEFRTVTVVAGATTAKDIPAIGLCSEPTAYSGASIVGFVTDGSNPSNTLCAKARADAKADGKTATCTVTFTLRDQDATVVPLAAGSGTVEAADPGPTAYTLHLAPEAKAQPGVYKLSISAIGKIGTTVATTYLPVTVTVRLPLDGAASAPAANLFLANTISGQVSADHGDLSDDGSGTPVTNCVYAVPVGAAAPDLSKPCDPKVDGADTSLCTVTGAQGPAYAALNADDSKGPLGSYSMTVCDGWYFVYVAIENPWFSKTVTYADGTSDPQLVIVSKGQPYTLPDATAELLGRITLTAKQFPLGSTAAVSFSSAQTIDLSCVDAAGNKEAISPTSFSTSTSATIGGLYGSPTCTGTVVGATNFAAAQVTGFTPDAGSPPAVEMDFHQTVGIVFGRVVTKWSGPTDGVGGGSVTIDGTTADGSGPKSVTPASDGCFAITTTGTLPSTATIPSVCTALAGDSSAVVAMPLTEDSAKFTVSPAAGYRVLTGSSFPATMPVESSNPIDDLTFEVYPDAVTLSGLKVRTDPDTGAGLDGFAISVATDASSNPEQPSGAGNVSISVADDGTITWQDDQFSTDDQIAPGTYTITTTDPDYVGSYTFTCAPSGQCTVGSTPGQGDPVSTHPFTVDKLGSLTVNLAEDGGAPITDAVVTLHHGTAEVIGLTSTGTANPDGTYTVTMNGVVPTDDVASKEPYWIRVQAAGYQFGDSNGSGAGAVTLVCGGGTDPTPTFTIDPGQDLDCAATPVRDGAIKGQVILVMGDTAHVQYPGAGTPVVACPGTEVGEPQDGTCPSGAHALTGATTGTDGKFTLTGDTDVQGLDPNTKWTLSASLTGYNGGHQTVTLPAEGATGWPDYEINSNPADNTDPCTDTTNVCLDVRTVTVQVTVTDQAGSVCDGLTVRVHGDYGDKQATSCESGQSYYEFDDVVPGGLDVTVHQYAISASGYGYTTNSQNNAVKLNDGSSGTQIQTFDLPIQRDQSTVSGTVKAVQDHTAASGIAGATVCLVAATSAPSVPSSTASCAADAVATQATGSSGGFSLANIPDTPEDPSGTKYYLIVIPPYGYDGAVSDGFTVSSDGDDHAEPAFTLAQITNKLVVTVTNETEAEDLSDPSWGPTLTSSTDSAWVLAPAESTYDATSHDTTFTWNSVPTGCWTLSFAHQPPDHHAALTASTPWPSDSKLSCTGNQIAVSDAAVSAGQVAAGYTFDEYQPKVKLTLDRLALDPNATSADVPTTVVQGGTTLYSTTLTVPTAGLNQALSVWVSGSVHVVYAPASPWTVDHADTTVTATVPTATATVSEQGSTVTITLGDNANGVSVSLASSDGFDAPTPVVTSGGGKAVFDDIPYGGWTASATGYDDKSVTVNGPTASGSLTKSS